MLRNLIISLSLSHARFGATMYVIIYTFDGNFFAEPFFSWSDVADVCFFIPSKNIVSEIIFRTHALMMTGFNDQINLINHTSLVFVQSARRVSFLVPSANLCEEETTIINNRVGGVEVNSKNQGNEKL